MSVFTSIYETIKEIPENICFYLRQSQIAFMPEAKKPYHKLSAVALRQMQKQQEPFFLLDVRTKIEFDGERIPGSIHMETEEVSNKITETIPSFDSKIVIYCHGGERSIEVAEILHKKGYRQIYYLNKGIAQWPYATEKASL